MHYTCNTKGVCAQTISFDINDNKISNISFNGGCPGNLKMISKLLDGKDVDYVIKMCKGNTCGYKNTSCADQLAEALIKIKDNK